MGKKWQPREYLAWAFICKLCGDVVYLRAYIHGVKEEVELPTPDLIHSLMYMAAALVLFILYLSRDQTNLPKDKK